MGNKIWQTIYPRKFGYDVAYARPPVQTRHVTIDLAQLDQPFCYVSHPYGYDQIESCQNQAFADNYHMNIFYVLIGQNLTGKFMRKIYAASGNLLTELTEFCGIL